MLDEQHRAGHKRARLMADVVVLESRLAQALEPGIRLRLRNALSRTLAQGGGGRRRGDRIIIADR